MINAEQLKQYHRQLALYCLQSVGEPLTAAEVAELMQTTALNSMHADQCWQRIDAGKAAGTLKALFNAGSVLEAPPVRNARQGRDQARWAQNPDSERAELPECPGEAPQATVAQPGLPEVLAPSIGADPYSHMSRTQLVALVTAQDELDALLNRFTGELAEWKQRTRVALAVLE